MAKKHCIALQSMRCLRNSVALNSLQKTAELTWTHVIMQALLDGRLLDGTPRGEYDGSIIPAVAMHLYTIITVATYYVYWLSVTESVIVQSKFFDHLICQIRGIQGTKVRRYNWHSAGSLGRPFPMLKYIFLKYNIPKQFYQTASGNYYNLKLPKC